jgi:ABC-type multidrug transport system ATPase subunit
MISDGASAARDAASSTSSDTLVVSIRQLRKAFRGKPVVHCDTLDIRRGELCGLFGPNGSGKTALIKTLAGVYIPDDGEVLLDGVVYEPLPVWLSSRESH